MVDARVQSMMRTNIELGRRVTLSLLGSASVGRRSGRRDRASGATSCFPGTWISLRSKSAKSNSHRACRQFRCCACLKYVRFL